MLVLIDTGAFYALADDSDRNARAARSFFRERLETEQFATTNAIVFESWSLLRGRLGWNAAYRFMEGLRKSAISLLHAESVDLELAWRIIGEYSGQELSVVDALSFAMMERHGISEVFTFDKDFLLYRYGPKKQRSFRCWPDR